ncbi:hypothetical protein BGZ91_004937, partial [Linnemannia elongata]
NSKVVGKSSRIQHGIVKTSLEAHEAWTAPDKYREVMVDRVDVRIYFYGFESRQHQFLTCSIVRSNSPTAVFAARVVP